MVADGKKSGYPATSEWCVVSTYASGLILCSTFVIYIVIGLLVDPKLIPVAC